MKEIIFFTIGSILLIIGYVVMLKIEGLRGFLSWIFSMFGFMFLMLFINTVTEKRIYKDSLKGINPYEMQIDSTFRQGELIKIDTVFIKIKRNE